MTSDQIFLNRNYLYLASLCGITCIYCLDMYNDAEQQIYWLEDSVEMNSDLETTATFYISPDMQHFKSVNQWTEGE